MKKYLFLVLLFWASSYFDVTLANQATVKRQLVLENECPPCSKECYIAGFFIASDVLNVLKVGRNFDVTLLGTEVDEEGTTLGIYAVTFRKPFVCPVSVVAFSSGISFSGDAQDCSDIEISRLVEVKSGTRSHAVLRAPIGSNVTFKVIPVT